MKYIKTFEQFVNESELSKSTFNLILEKRGLIDILKPDLGERVKGSRADKAFYKAADKLKAAGYKEIKFNDSVNHSNDNVNRSASYEHDLSPLRITLNLYLGYKASDNSFTYSVGEKPMTITIKNDSDYKEKMSYYSDLSELEIVLFGQKREPSWMGTDDVDSNMRKYILAELKALADYSAKKVDIKRLSRLGIGLLDNKDFQSIVKERGCKIQTSYLGNDNQIRVNYDSNIKPFNTETLMRYIDSNERIFIDGRIGMAYIKLNDESDVNYLISQLLKIPAIF